MEVAIPGSNNGGSGGCSPFQREVREWQRIDPNTGALLTGRLEADRWINGALNTYGKLVDSQNVSQPNGTQHSQRKQLEVLQSRTASGAMQVIRAQTVQTTSSRWSSSSGNNSPSLSAHSSGTTSTVASTPTSAAPINNSCNINSGLFNRTTAATSVPITSSNATTSHKQRFSNHGEQVKVTTTARNGFHDSLHSPLMGLTSATSNGHITLKELDIYEEEEHDHLTNNFLNHHRRQQQPIGLSNLLNTAPSLKLSNLMKSSSNVSSGNGNKSITSTNRNSGIYGSGTTGNHQNAKISLRALGRFERNENTSTSMSSAATKLTAVTSTTTSTTATTTTTTATATATAATKPTRLQTTLSNLSHSSAAAAATTTATSPPPTDTGRYHRLQRYDHLPTILGMESASLRVGGAVSAVCNNVVDSTTGGDDRVSASYGINRTSLPPTQQHRLLTGMESFRHPNHDNSDDDTARENLQSYQLQRGRSVSTDDLSTDWDPNGNDNEEPTEWRRVSKLRRSFQSTTSSGEVVNLATSRRPLDLPESSVSVSKIRSELENGRRLNTAMRNNHVDLAALDTILNGSERAAHKADMKTSPKKTTSFLTAESLKEIRGKLKKLSDESLYKDDFITHQNATKTEDAQAREVCLPPRHEESTSAFHLVPRHHNPCENVIAQEHTTNSLENRVKHKDTTSTEWHLRRKSYGFEKMSPPNDKTMFRMESSTDSGIGRSSELANWSPTESATPTRGTVITFGEFNGPARAPAVTRRFQSNHHHHHSTVGTTTTANTTTTNLDELKRHSIAVDESQYVRDNLRKTSVHLNGFYNREPDLPFSNSSSSSAMFNRKRVEFCKTEVHFAAESGRVNIVETDGKPPPTNNFRRRRRTTGGGSFSVSSPIEESVSPVNCGLPVIHFGDDRRRTDSPSILIKEEDADRDDAATTASNVTVSVYPSATDVNHVVRNNYTFEPSDTDADETSGIRGILKNKPIKPKPYHLGENFENPDILWGVQLKPVGMSSMLQNKKKIFSENEKTIEDDDCKELPPIGAMKTPTPAVATARKSVAERIRIVEERKDPTNGGYSTKINLNLSNSPYEGGDLGSVHGHDRTHNTILQNLKVNQQILAEGLKSTSLIIKTMRSASQFDEAMRRLSISSIEAAPNEMESMEEELSTKQDSMDYDVDQTCSSKFYQPIKPIAAPRLKVLENSNLISHQLSQLRRMYAAQDDESADEEVKGYFPNNNNSDSGTQDSSSVDDDKLTEWSGSWSRLKARRTVLRVQSEQEIIGKEEKHEDHCKDTPKTNVMNIELYSPQVTLKKSDCVRTSERPVAKPRTMSTVKQIQDEFHSTTDSNNSNMNTKEPLKIIKEARGARKLREHELSYFGVNISSNRSTHNTSNSEQPQQTKLQLTTKNPKRTLPHRRISKASSRNNENSIEMEKWNLVSDKPDLLRHSTIDNDERTTTDYSDQTRHYHSNSLSSLDMSDEESKRKDDDIHIYENIINKSNVVKSTGVYSRKDDTERDEMILSEMTRAADQTLKALSDEAAVKDRRRRSLSRRQSIPLETIDEKCAEKKISNVIVKISRDTLASEARKLSRNSSPSPVSPCRRTSSTSSGENMPTVRSRSRSRSIDKHNAIDDAKLKNKIRLHQQQKQSSRSSSQESVQSNHSSSEDFKNQENNNRLRSKNRRLNATTTQSATTTATQATRQQQRANKEKESQRDECRRVRSARSGSNASATTDKVSPRSITRDRVDGHDHNQEQQAQQQRIINRHRNCTNGNSGNSSNSPKTAIYHEHKRSGIRSNRLSGDKIDKIPAGVSSNSNSSSRLTRNRSEQDSSNRSSKRSDKIIATPEKLSRCKGPTTHPMASAENPNPQFNATPTNVVSPSKYRFHATAAEVKRTGTTTPHTLSGNNSDNVTYVLEQPLVTRIIPPPRKKRLKSKSRNAISIRHSPSKTSSKQKSFFPLYIRKSKNHPIYSTQSTTSSFTFLPTKGVQPSYDSYVLYATPESVLATTMKMKNSRNMNLTTSGGQRFAAINIQSNPVRTNRNKSKQRSRESLRYPFGICACS